MMCEGLLLTFSFSFFSSLQLCNLVKLNANEFRILLTSIVSPQNVHEQQYADGTQFFLYLYLLHPCPIISNIAFLSFTADFYKGLALDPMKTVSVFGNATQRRQSRSTSTSVRMTDTPINL